VTFVAVIRQLKSIASLKLFAKKTHFGYGGDFVFERGDGESVKKIVELSANVEHLDYKSESEREQRNR
jgi:hypothetical protein